MLTQYILRTAEGIALRPKHTHNELEWSERSMNVKRIVFKKKKKRICLN